MEETKLTCADASISRIMEYNSVAGDIDSSSRPVAVLVTYEGGHLRRRSLPIGATVVVNDEAIAVV